MKIVRVLLATCLFPLMGCQLIVNKPVFTHGVVTKSVWGGPKSARWYLDGYFFINEKKINTHGVTGCLPYGVKFGNDVYKGDSCVVVYDRDRPTTNVIVLDTIVPKDWTDHFTQANREKVIQFMCK